MEKERRKKKFRWTQHVKSISNSKTECAILNGETHWPYTSTDYYSEIEWGIYGKKETITESSSNMEKTIGKLCSNLFNDLPFVVNYIHYEWYFRRAMGRSDRIIYGEHSIDKMTKGHRWMMRIEIWKKGRKRNSIVRHHVQSLLHCRWFV